MRSSYSASSRKSSPNRITRILARGHRCRIIALACASSDGPAECRRRTRERRIGRFTAKRRRLCAARLDGDHAGSTLILLGDVSGKGLKAAMAVSLVVGMIRTLAETTSSPAKMLAGLDRLLEGRLRQGFVTCIAVRMDAGGKCALASAGHPAPFLNGRELTLPGSLPLGLSGTASYEETVLRLNVGDHFVLYTDGLLEARSTSGELFGFERMDALFATGPDAARAAEAAVTFGQDDDITVLTFTRLAAGQESTTQLASPKVMAKAAQLTMCKAVPRVDAAIRYIAPARARTAPIQWVQRSVRAQPANPKPALG